MSQRRAISHSYLITGLLVLIVALFSGCGSTAPLPEKGEKAVSLIAPLATPQPTPVKIAPATPACDQPVCLAPATFPGERPVIDTWDNIHIAQVFSYNMGNAQDVSGYYDFVWGADPATVAALRAGNPNIILSYYVSMNRDSGVFGNQDLGPQHGLAYWQALHPDWILYQCDRTTPAYEINDPNIPLDMTNPAVIDWQMQTYAIPASEAGYDALAADNLNLNNAFGACGFYRNGQWVQRYNGQADDPQWRKDMLYWVTQMQQKLHALPHPLALVPNIGYFGSRSIANVANDPIFQQILQHVDGVLDESGFTHYGDGYITDTTWLQMVNLIQSVQQQHKPYYIIDEFSKMPVSTGDAQWALASYLMAKDHLADLFYNGTQSYGSDMRHPEYNAQIGMPTTDMFQSQGVYWRLFSNGLALVNPSSSQTYTITLQLPDLHLPAYQDLYGQPIGQTVTLQPHSGLVLLNP